MLWLSRLNADTGYLGGIAVPMILIGAGQGAALGPLTAAGIAGVESRDAGAASGVVNVAHQLGGSLGLGLLITAAADAASADAAHRFAHQVAVALTVGTGLLALAFALAMALMVRQRQVAR
jgi:sugar phosphate permease